MSDWKPTSLDFIGKLQIETHSMLLFPCVLCVDSMQMDCKQSGLRAWNPNSRHEGHSLSSFSEILHVKVTALPIHSEELQVYNFDSGLGIEEGTWVTDRQPHLLGHYVESQEPGCTALRRCHLSISGGRFPCSPLCRLLLVLSYLCSKRVRLPGSHRQAASLQCLLWKSVSIHFWV